MKFYDLSLALSEKTPVWPGQQLFSREEHKSSAIVSKISMSSHFGTHIDAQKHFVFSGAGIDKVSLNSLIGNFEVIEIKSKHLISLEEIRTKKIKAGQRLLIKTPNSKFISSKKEFTADYTSLSLEAAKYLASRKILLVGIDYFGIEAKSAPGHPVHMALLSKGIVVVEGLDLSKIQPGKYSGAILPLKITDSDGSPCRAVLWK